MKTSEKTLNDYIYYSEKIIKERIQRIIRIDLYRSKDYVNFFENVINQKLDERNKLRKDQIERLTFSQFIKYLNNFNIEISVHAWQIRELTKNIF